MALRLTTNLQTLRILLPKGQRLRWLLVIGGGLAVAVSESVAAGVIALLVDTLSNPDQATTSLPFLSGLRDLADSFSIEPVLFIGALAATTFLLKALLVLAQTYVQARVTQSVGYRLSSRVYEGYVTMPYIDHTMRNSAELLRNSSWAAEETVNNFLSPLAHMVTQGLTLAFLAGLLVVATPLASLLVVGLVVPVAFVVLRIQRPILGRLGRSTQARLKDTIASVQQSLRGIRDIKGLGREREFIDEFKRSRRELARARYLAPTIGEIPSLVVETTLVFGVVAYLVLAQGNAVATSLPLLALFAYAGLRMMPAFASVTRSMNRIRYGQAAADILVSELQMLEEVSVPLPRVRPERLDFSDALELEDVSFTYPDGTVALRDVTMSVPKGTRVGIVGVTGSGKSTLLDLIMGLLVPTKGTIRVDNRNLEEVVRSWQAIIGFVSQMIYMKDDTLRNNVAFGQPPNEIDEEELRDALATARLSNFVEELPAGLDTLLGEHGVRLSGGQRQRVAIARALYRRPDVLILDEGTASLDRDTEIQVMERLEEFEGKTLIMVAHRIATVRSCDVIHIVSEGQIIDSGTYDELLARSGAFRKLVG
ncbi:MAG TPA: ABC transporter ATP-binding protein [Acidimicrobiia bacterium]|nr:ABC transporter ATP-binding protein [Acidimicrobiia bacterium]